MADEIKVRVVEFGDRAHYQLQWRDPLTGLKRTKSSGVERTGRKRERTEAERKAAQLEADLREGRYAEPSKITWEVFRDRYDAEVLPGLAPTTRKKVDAVFNLLEAELFPKRLRDLTAARLSHLQKRMREMGRTEATVKGHFAHLQAALNWAVRMGMLVKVPTIEKPKRARQQKVMRGRPVTTEEFERMLARVPGVLTGKPNRQRKRPKLPTPEAVASWVHYLKGLWLSGLRLAESLELSWDDPRKLCVDLDARRPMLRIPAALEKGNRDRLLPMAPEFAEFLQTTPEGERTGYVFNPAPRRPERSARLAELQAGRIVSAIGEAAGVVVDRREKLDPNTGGTREVVKYASAHDFRRSFGERWARRVMPQVLMELMRHESIETTLRFYVGRNAESTADVLWEAHERAGSNTFGNTGQNHPSDGASQETQNPLPSKGLS